MNKLRHQVVALAVALLVPASALPASVSDSRSWEFSVLLDGSKIGYHNFELERRDGAQELRSEASFDVRFLFVTAFRYRHTNLEIWSDGCLNRIESSTRQNGKRQSVSGARIDDVFEFDAGDRSGVLPECVMTFAYWNPEFLEQPMLLNPQTGEYLSVDVEALGYRDVVARGESVRAAAYRLTARDIEMTVWYSDNDEWLGLESIARGGRVLRYELT